MSCSKRSRRASTDKSVGCVLLTGAGAAFCSGRRSRERTAERRAAAPDSRKIARIRCCITERLRGCCMHAEADDRHGQRRGGGSRSGARAGVRSSRHVPSRRVDDRVRQGGVVRRSSA